MQDIIHFFAKTLRRDSPNPAIFLLHSRRNPQTFRVEGGPPSYTASFIELQALAFDPIMLIGRFIHHRDVFGHVILIFGSAPPATDSTHKIFDGACPSDQNVLLPCRMLQGKTEGQTGRINTDGYADNGIAYR